MKLIKSVVGILFVSVYVGILKAVPLLAAKPIIDLDVVIDRKDLKEVIFFLKAWLYL